MVTHDGHLPPQSALFARKASSGLRCPVGVSARREGSRTDIRRHGARQMIELGDLYGRDYHQRKMRLARNKPCQRLTWSTRAFSTSKHAVCSSKRAVCSSKHAVCSPSPPRSPAMFGFGLSWQLGGKLSRYCDSYTTPQDQQKNG